MCGVAARTKVMRPGFGPITIVKGPSTILRDSITLNILYLILGVIMASCPIHDFR